jgi:hypothetical protein
MKETNPDKKLTEISKMIAAEWKKFDGAAKKPYENEAKENKARYQNELKKYKETQEYRDFQKKLKQHKEEKDDGTSKRKGKKTNGKRRRPKDPNAPKKPQSAYFLFANDRRPKLRETHPDKKITDVAKMLGAEWKEMSEAEKKPWEELAKKNKEKHDKEMEEYKKTDEYLNYQKKIETRGERKRINTRRFYRQF